MTAHDADRASGGYQLYIYCGDEPAPSLADASLVPIVAGSCEEAVAAVEASPLTAADLRTRTLFVAASRDIEKVAALYAALCGFAGRPLDFSDLDQVVDMRALRKSFSELPEVARPAVVEDCVIVGPGVGDDLMGPLDLSTIARLRYAKDALMLPFGGVRPTLEVLAVFSAVRAKSESDRFPRLVRLADAPLGMTAQPPLGELLERSIDLDLLRREGARVRRGRRIDDRASVVETLPVDARRLRLLTAAALPVEGVLDRLGSHENSETGFWRCPRPDRHRNGDANPSAKVSEGLFRCFKCDPEYVDSLRLVMDVHRCAPDDAADWLLSR